MCRRLLAWWRRFRQQVPGPQLVVAAAALVAVGQREQDVVEGLAKGLRPLVVGEQLEEVVVVR